MLLLKKITNTISHSITYVVVGLGILLITFYAGSKYMEISVKQHETNLLGIGNDYIDNINSSIERYRSITEITALSFAKTIDNENFMSTVQGIVRTCMTEYDDIKLATMVLNSTYKERDNIFLDDSTLLYHVNWVYEGNKIVNTVSNFEVNDKQFKRTVAALITREQTKLITPQSIMINDNFTTVMPIISIMYKGNYFLGYLIFYIDLSSKTDKYKKDNNHEIFVFTQSGKLISSNLNAVFFNDDMSTICSSCVNNNRNGKYYTTSEKGLKTLCFTYSFENSNEKWNVCIRSKINKYAFTKKLLIIWSLSAFCIIISFLVIYYKSQEVKIMWQKASSIIQAVLKGTANANELQNINNTEQEQLKNSIIEINQTVQGLVNNSKKLLSGKTNNIEEISQFNKEIYNSHTEFYKKFVEISEALNVGNKELDKLQQNNLNLKLITDLVKKNHADIVVMMDLMIQKVVSLLDFEMGAVFLKTTKRDNIFLEQTVSYAYNEKKNNKLVFKLGDSLIGACAAEKRIVHLKKVPQDYLRIISGLGDAPPKSMLIVPILFENETLGVIELGSLHDIHEDTVRFIEKIAENIAVVLYLAQNNSRNLQLLEQSKIDKQIIVEQNKTIKDSLSELQEIHNKTKKNEAFVKAKLEAAGHALMTAEYNPKGVLLDSNFKFINTLHYSLEELTNKNIVDLIDKHEREKIDKIINSVKLGSTHETIIYMNTGDNHKKEIYSVYAPLFDDTGTLKNILFFGVDITELGLNTD